MRSPEVTHYLLCGFSEFLLVYKVVVSRVLIFRAVSQQRVRSPEFTNSLLCGFNEFVWVYNILVSGASRLRVVLQISYVDVDSCWPYKVVVSRASPVLQSVRGLIKGVLGLTIYLVPLDDARPQEALQM